MPIKFTVADVLDQLLNAECLPVTKLEKTLGVSTKSERSQLRTGLDALLKLGIVKENEDGLQRNEAHTFIPARLRCSGKGFCFALRDDGGEDVYIREHLLNNAWNDDRVLVKITREGGKRRSPEGSVQCILQRNTLTLLALLERQNDRLIAIPLDDRLLTTLELESSDTAYLNSIHESIADVQVDYFPVGQFPPLGHVLRSLPVNGGEAADLDLLLTKHHLAGRANAPRTALKSPPAKGRDDHSTQPTFLFQGWSGADAPILPALAVEERNEGWRLWVHTPTIAERVSLGNTLDNWMLNQAESTSTGSHWLSLLSTALHKAASLHPGEIQSVISVALDLNSDGTLEHYRFSRSLIRPVAKVDYKALQALAERKPRTRVVPTALKPLKGHFDHLQSLLAVTELLRQQRLDAGSTDLDLATPPLDRLGDLLMPSPSVILNGWLDTFGPQQPMAILREAMLLANRALGLHMKALGLPAIYSCHAAADETSLNDVAKAALALEIPLELDASGNINTISLVEAFRSTDRSRALQQLLRDVLNPVNLSDIPGPCSVAGASEAYASWCSPAQHYVDIWNQQLLVSLLSGGKARPSVRHKTRVDLASDSCHGCIEWALLTPSQLAPFHTSLQHRLIQRLQDRRRVIGDFQADCIAMAQARAAEPLVGQTLSGMISGVQSYGFFVEVPPSLVEGLVHVSSLKDDWYEYRSRQNLLIGRKSRRTFMVGDRVEVEVQKIDSLRHQIDLGIVLPALEKPYGTAASVESTSLVGSLKESSDD